VCLSRRRQHPAWLHRRCRVHRPHRRPACLLHQRRRKHPSWLPVQRLQGTAFTMAEGRECMQADSRVHVRRESLGFVHRSRTIFCRPVRNLSVTIRNFCIAVRCRYVRSGRTRLKPDQSEWPHPHPLSLSLTVRCRTSQGEGRESRTGCACLHRRQQPRHLPRQLRLRPPHHDPSLRLTRRDVRLHARAPPLHPPEQPRLASIAPSPYTL
jgi:hypothetical protein